MRACVCVFACAYLCACAPVRAGGGGVQKGRDLLFPLAKVQVEMGSAAQHGSFRARGPAGPWSFVGAAGAERAVPGLSVPESGCACRRPAPRIAIAWCSALSRRLYISSISSLFFCLLLSFPVILFASPLHSQLKRKKKSLLPSKYPSASSNRALISRLLTPSGKPGGGGAERYPSGPGGPPRRAELGGP